MLDNTDYPDYAHAVSLVNNKYQSFCICLFLTEKWNGPISKRCMPWPLYKIAFCYQQLFNISIDNFFRYQNESNLIISSFLNLGTVNVLVQIWETF